MPLLFQKNRVATVLHIAQPMPALLPGRDKPIALQSNLALPVAHGVPAHLSRFSGSPAALWLCAV